MESTISATASTWGRPWSFILDHSYNRIMSAWSVLNPVYLVRSFYLACIIAILTARLLSPLRQRFLAYGARTQHEIHQKPGKFEKSEIAQSSYKILDVFASVDVPHSWFTHFYIVSITSSCVWMWLLFLSSDALLSCNHPEWALHRRQSVQSAFVCLLLMLVQGIRRYLECIVVLKTSSSRMWIGHYAFGLAFYFFTNIAVWIESTNSGSGGQHPYSEETSIGSSAHVYIGLTGFALASVSQLQAHSYLAKLRKYTLPTQGLFPWLVAPHYTAECVIYLSLAVLGAPKHQMFNRTLLCATLLSALNLGVTAEGTKQWMLNKFRDQRKDIEKRWLLIPGIW